MSSILREQIALTGYIVMLLIGFLIGTYKTDKELHRLAGGRVRGVVKLSKCAREWLVLYDKKRYNRTFVVSIIANVLTWVCFIIQMIFAMFATTESRLILAYNIYLAGAVLQITYGFIVLVVYSVPKKRW